MASAKITDYGDTGIKKREIIASFLHNPHEGRFSKSKCVDKGVNVVSNYFGNTFHPHDTQKIRKYVQILQSDFQKRYRKHAGHAQNFFNENSVWLDTYFRMPAKFLISLPVQTTSSKVTATTRKTKPFEESASSTKRRKLAIIRKEQARHTIKETVLAASKSAKITNQQDWSFALASVSSPGRASNVLIKLKQPDLKQFTPDEALNFFLEKRMTVNVYKELRKESKSRGADIYPTYFELNTAREKCRPDANLICIEEFSAEVNTEGLLHHTAQRLIELQEEVIEHIFATHKCSTLQLKLICSWGCVGSSSHSIYKQKSNSHERDDVDESHLFVTTMTPLRLVALIGRRSKEIVLWNNPLPQSYRSCRPLKLQHKKETKALTLEEISRVKSDIALLSNFTQTFKNGKQLSVTFTMLLTVIDGKILAAIEDTPVQCCPLCKSKPNDFNVKENIGTARFEATDSALQHGASVLHARIRFMEALIHVRMRLEVQVWRVTDTKDKEKVARRKKEIQEKFKEILNLRIDFPNPGGSGTSNDGNTSRRFFENYETSASILGINKDLVLRFKNILTANNCQLPLNSKLFGEYCTETNNLFVDLYAWYKLPAYVHKILVHSEAIILASILPLGMLSEEGAESRHKLFRGNRLHSRKSSRINTMTDVLNRTLDTSDPFIAAYSIRARKNLRNRTPLPSEVMGFLENPTIALPSQSQSSSTSSRSQEEPLSQISDADNFENDAGN